MVEAKFCDIFTDFTCSNIINELTKFILYYKQQIPFTYDKLSYAIHKRRQMVQNDSKRFSQSERLFRMAEKNIDILEDIFANTSKTFSTNGFEISEIVFLFGGSILTPKQIYRVHLPIVEFGHYQKNHSRNMVMSEILGALVNSDELNEMLSMPLAPTNLFLLLRIRGELESEEWLVPKPRYKIPSLGQQINLNLKFETPDNVFCSCKGFQFFSDNGSFNNSTSSIPCKEEPITIDEPLLDPSWYQVPLVFQGFKDIYVGGLSVSSQWFLTNEQ